MPTEFTNAEFMTARDKELTLKDWRRFLSRGMAEKWFTNRLYHHLSQHCSFIAHYNRQGFYNVYFTNDAEMTVRFLNQFTTGRSAEYGDVSWWLDKDNRLGMRDINSAMMGVAMEFAPGLIQTARADEKTRDLAEAERLIHKHEPDYGIHRESWGSNACQTCGGVRGHKQGCASDPIYGN